MNKPDTARNRNRVKMILIMAVFAVPPLLALVLGAAGWQPGVSAHGQPIVPQRNVQDVVIQLAEGEDWSWRDPQQPRMTLVALPGPGCARQCMATLTLMHNARVRLNKNMDRVRLLYVGEPPRGMLDTRSMRAWTVGQDVADAFAQYRALQRDRVAALLVESNGTALAWYPAGFDANGLLDDMQEVFH